MPLLNYLGDGSGGITSEECDRLFERNASLSSDEVQSDEVNGLGWLDVDVSNKLVAVNNLRSVISFITYNQEVVHTSSRLDVSQVRIDVVLEESSCDLIVELEEEVLSSSGDCIFQEDEQTANVDSIEC